MHGIGLLMLSRLHDALPEATVYWEKEPAPGGLHGAVLTAELKHRKFTMRFEKGPESSEAETPDSSLVDQVVDDFLDFFARSIYPKEKFTRII